MVVDETSFFKAIDRLESNLLLVDLSLPTSKKISIARQIDEYLVSWKLNPKLDTEAAMTSKKLGVIYSEKETKRRRKPFLEYCFFGVLYPSFSQGLPRQEAFTFKNLQPPALEPLMPVLRRGPTMLPPPFLTRPV